MSRTSRKLEDLFDLGAPEDYEDSTPSVEETKQNILQQQELINMVDRIDAALPMIKNLEAHESEMDDLAERATKSFEDLSNLSMNMEARFGARMFEVAGQMLGHAINAKNAKMDKKLKAIELQLKKFKIDSDNNNNPGASAIEGDGLVIDRNELYKTLLGNLAKKE